MWPPASIHRLRRKRNKEIASAFQFGERESSASGRTRGAREPNTMREWRSLHDSPCIQQHHVMTNSATSGKFFWIEKFSILYLKSKNIISKFPGWCRTSDSPQFSHSLRHLRANTGAMELRHYIFYCAVVLGITLGFVYAVCCLLKTCFSENESHVTPTPTPSPELQTVPVTMSQRRMQQPSQVQPSAPPQEALKEERERLVNECLFSRILEEGDSVAFIESILAAAQDRYAESTEEKISSRSTKAHSKPECSICLDGYKTGETICWSKTNECDHIFHQDCIVEWMVDNDVCPLCRTNIMSFHHAP